MNLAKAPLQYDQTDESVVRRTLETEDKRNMKRGDIIDKLLFRDTVTGGVVTVTIASGVLVVT
jgi:hypothetical protein